MKYAFTALLEREGKFLPVTFGASDYEEAEVIASEIAASLGAHLKELRLTEGLPPVTAEPLPGAKDPLSPPHGGQGEPDLGVRSVSTWYYHQA